MYVKKYFAREKGLDQQQDSLNKESVAHSLPVTAVQRLRETYRLRREFYDLNKTILLKSRKA